MKDCPRCGSELKKDSKSIRCSNSECMYHLSKSEKRKYYEELKKNDRFIENLPTTERTKRFYYKKKGLQMGTITIHEAAALKGVTVETILSNLHLFHTTKKPLKIKFDSNFINCNLRNRKKRLRKSH